MQILFEVEESKKNYFWSVRKKNSEASESNFSKRSLYLLLPGESGFSGYPDSGAH